MGKLKQFKLNAAMKQTHDDLKAEGVVTSHLLTEEFIIRHPELIAENSDQLCRESISKRAQRVMGRNVTEVDAAQASLPLTIQGVRIPSNISVPANSDNGENTWEPIGGVTLKELDLHISMLEKQIKADGVRMRGMKKLYRLLEVEMANENPSAMIGPHLRKLAKVAA